MPPSLSISKSTCRLISPPGGGVSLLAVAAAVSIAVALPVAAVALVAVWCELPAASLRRLPW
eukprot:2265231-Prymnesium_polylepis.1